MDERPSPRARPLILIIEDDLAQRIILKETLEEDGFDIVEAESGAEGIAKATDMEPDLIILDVVMPNLDGFAVCGSLRTEPRTRHLPILMVTGLEDEDSVHKAFEVGATNFLTKPINWALLGHHINYILRASRNETELRAAKLKAELANEAKTQFLANMSHELRTPLNSIIGFADMAAQETLGPMGNPNYIEGARSIREAGDHLLQLINDILDLSKLEVGKATLLEEMVDLHDVVDTCARVVKGKAEEAGVDLTIAMPGRFPAVKGDEIKLRQVILNLLSNAIKFTPANGQVTISGTVDEAGGIEISVQDNGIGIAADNIPVALEPFRQIDADLNRRYPGTGLGLPLSKSLVELHGGSMALESAVGEGTRVTLRLPASRVQKGGKAKAV